MPIRRTLKNVVKNYTEAEVKVREATSNDPWGPSGTLMSEIARLTHDMVSYTEIMQIIWKRLNDSGKNWRHVYKTLLLLDYLVKAGSENVARACRENIYTIQTLKDFQYVEEGKDYGMNVREKAKQLTLLLKDEERLKNERTKMTRTRERLTPGTRDWETPEAYADSWGRAAPGGDGYNQHRSIPTDGPRHQPTQRQRSASLSEVDAARPSSPGEEELQLQLALAMSKEEHDAEVKREKSEEAKIAMAIEASKRDQEHRQKARPASQPSTLLQSQKKPASADLFSDDDGYSQVLGKQLQDPWATPSRPQASAFKSPGNDPWSAAPPTTAVINDPWGESPSPSSQMAASYSLSSVPNYSINAGTSSGAWGSSSGAAYGANGAKSTVDEFDIFSSRPASNQPMAMSAGPTGPTGNSTRDTAASEFLGTNRDLVDLDNLVAVPQNRSVNPFAMNRAVNNPFTAPRETAARVPMSMLAASQQQAQGGSFQAYPGGPQGLPPPLVPMNTQAGGRGGTNPFL